MGLKEAVQVIKGSCLVLERVAGVIAKEMEPPGNAPGLRGVVQRSSGRLGLGLLEAQCLVTRGKKILRWCHPVGLRGPWKGVWVFVLWGS